MSGPNPPGREPDDSAGESSAELEPISDAGDELDAGLDSDLDSDLDSGEHSGELEPLGDSGHVGLSEQTSETEAYSRAYSAPESEQFISGSYVPADLRLYDYDGYDDSSDLDDEHGAPRWPWVVGVAAILAAIALVISVSLLVTRTDSTATAERHAH